MTSIILSPPREGRRGPTPGPRIVRVCDWCGVEVANTPYRMRHRRAYCCREHYIRARIAICSSRYRKGVTE